jgi:hypothetical protein
MSRSKHTRPRRIIAADRVRAPHQPRGAGDLSREHRKALSLKALGLCPEQGPASDELPPRLPRLCVQRPRAGHLHPAGRADLESVLHFFGPEHYYGLRSISLLRAPAGQTGHLLLGRLLVPGRIQLYEQPAPPWLLTQPLAPTDAERLRCAGTVVESLNAATRWLVHWPGQTLHDFMLLDVFLHELGHHVVQQYTGKRSVRVARTRDHEAFADHFARRCRLAFLAAQESPR